MFTKLNSVQTRYLQLSEKKCICKCVLAMKSRHRGLLMTNLIETIMIQNLFASFRCAFKNDISRHFPLLDDLSKQF